MKYKIIHKETGLPPEQPEYFRVLYFAKEDGTVWSYFAGDGGEGIMELETDYKAELILN